MNSKEYLADRLNEQVEINEMSTVARDKYNNVMIQVNPDRNRIGNEYFKFYDATSFEAAEKFARISFYEPRYVNHANMFGKKKWVLNRAEKARMIEFLKSESKKYKGCTVFQAAIIDHNIEKGLDDPEEAKQIFSSSNNTDYIAIDIEMPNYMDLP